MATESDVVVGSKWRWKDDADSVRSAYWGNEFTIKSIVDTAVWYEYAAGGPACFKSADKILRDATRIDQPPEKAGEDVPVGSRWKWRSGGEVCEVVSDPDDVGEMKLRWLNVSKSMLSGYIATASAKTIKQYATRLDTPQEAPPAAKRCAQCKWPSEAGMKYCSADCLLLASRERIEATPPKCLTTCGPASPCLTTELCRSRDTQERMAYTQTKLSDDKYDYVGKRPRTGPPQPGINGMGSLVGQFSYELPRHKRAR